MIIQVGAYPPPIGGVSIYNMRMKDFLDSIGIENQVWDYHKIGKSEDGIVNIRFLFIPLYYALRKDVDIIHYNMSGTITKNYIGFFNRMFFKNRKKMITIHGDCTGLFDKNRKLITKSLNSFNVIICVKKNDKEYLLEHGISSDIYEIPAFIPPIVQEHEIKEIDQKMWEFIDNHKPIISTNASRLVFYNSQDLYGIDMCIDLCANLKKDYPQIGLVCCLSVIKEYKYYERMKKLIMEKGLQDNILFYTAPRQFYPILMKSDVFVRPTITDGDAISVREALYFKIPNVVSDVVPRPEGTILFRNRDQIDFYSKVNDVIKNYDIYKKRLDDVHLENDGIKILKIYKQLIES
jgi:glycosyltransferase involved in cell wall biosynthesis